MKENYSYPLDVEWSHQEIICVMNVFQAVEKVYEKGMKGSDFLAVYQAFKQVIKSIGEERGLGKEFEQVSGYSLYRCVQAAKATPERVIKLRE